MSLEDETADFNAWLENYDRIFAVGIENGWLMEQAVDYEDDRWSDGETVLLPYSPEKRASDLEARRQAAIEDAARLEEQRLQRERRIMEAFK